MKAESPEQLRTELKRFYIYVNDARIIERSRYFKLLMSHSGGAVEAELKSYITHLFGTLDAYYAAMDNVPSQEWKQHWDIFYTAY